jgi:hypothetical protein
MTQQEAGYEFAVKLAIENAHDARASRYYEGMAAGLQTWANAAPYERWKTDQYRIQEARGAHQMKQQEAAQ